MELFKSLDHKSKVVFEKKKMSLQYFLWVITKALIVFALSFIIIQI